MSFQIGSIPMMWMRWLISEREVIKELTDANETTKLTKETYLTFKNIIENVSMYLGIFLEVQSRGSHFFESRYGLKSASYMQHRRAGPSFMRLWATLLSNPIHKWGKAKAEISFIMLFHSQPGLQTGFTMKLMMFSAIHKINLQQPANKINIISTIDSSDYKKRKRNSNPIV